MNRSEARSIALQSLYQIDMADIPVEEAIENVISEGDRSFILHLVHGVQSNKEEIDARIKPLLKGWSMNRLSYIDRTILRIAAFELLFEEQTPDAVAINEAVELAKKFGDEKSSKFINGVLSNLKKEKQNKQ